jgi:hypothetical protein
MLRNTTFAVLALATAAFAQSYCIPQISGYTCGSDEYISNVTVANVNNNSTCIPAPGYEDFTNTVAAAQLTPGQTYPISVAIGTSWSSDVVYVMLDVDGNGTIDTTPAGGELLATLGPLTFTGGTQTVTGQIDDPGCGRSKHATSCPPVLRRVGRRAVGLVSPDSSATRKTTPVVTSTGPVVPEYQVNSPAASHDFNGIQGTAYGAANVSKCAGDTFTINLNSTNVGFPFDVLVSPLPLVPVSQGGLYTGTQAVNVNLFAFVWGFGGFTTLSSATWPYRSRSAPRRTSTRRWR